MKQYPCFFLYNLNKKQDFSDLKKEFSFLSIVNRNLHRTFAPENKRRTAGPSHY